MRVFANKYALLLAGAAILAALGLAVFLLGGHDAATSAFRSSLEQSFASLDGWSFEAGEVSGNPVAGFHASDIRIAFKGEEVARAESLSVGLSLLSLIRGDGRLSRIDVANGSLSGEGLLRAMRGTDLSMPEAGGPLPIIVLSPARIDTPAGAVSFDTLRLTPKEDTLTFYGQGSFLGFPIEAGISFLTGGQLTATDGFFRGGDAVVSLSGPVYPETRLEGFVDDLRLDFISELVHLPLTAKGTVDSTLLLERPDGDLLVSGEGEIEGGDIWDLLIDGTFAWSADDRKAVLYPSKASVFSSPASGALALFFGSSPRAELSLAFKRARLDEWTRCFSWLSFAEGELSTLNLDLSGPITHLSGPIHFVAREARIQGFDVSSLSGDLRMTDGDRLDISGGGRWAGSAFSFSGESLFEDPDRTATKISLRAVDLDLESAAAIVAPGLAAQGSGSLSVEVSVPPEGTAVYSGVLSAKRGTAVGTPFTELSASFSGCAEELSITTLSLSPGGKGTVAGKGRITGLGTSPGLSAEGTAKGLGWWLLADGGESSGLKGQFDATWRLEGPALSPVATFSLTGGETPLSGALPLTAIRLDGRYEDGALKASSASASLFGGSVRGDGQIQPNGALSFKGGFEGLSASRIASAADMQEAEAAGTLSGEFSVGGTLDSPTAAITCSSQSISVSGLEFVSPRVKLEGSADSLKVADFSAVLMGAKVGLSGVLGLSRGERTDLALEVGELDLHKLATLYFPKVRVAGSLFAKLKLEGKAGDDIEPVITGTIPFLSAYGILAEEVKFSLVPEPGDALSLSLEGRIGESRLALEGTATATEEGIDLELHNTARIDLDATLAALSTQSAGVLSGFADFKMSGRLGDAVEVDGALTSREMSVYGQPLSDVRIPFGWTGGAIDIVGGSGVSHGGDLRFDGKLDPATMRFEGSASVKGMDLESASRTLFEGRGTITGTADLTIRGSGTGGMLGLVFGSGQLAAKEGAVSGFEAIKSVSGSGTIPFSSVLASFNMDGRSIFLLPGSRMSAPVGDDVYRYLSASGSVGWGDSPLDLKCLGDINVRALNAFIGAMQGFLLVDGNPLTDPQFLQRFLSGLVGGIAGRDFRETTFNLKGTWDSPEMTDLKVSSAGAPPAILPSSNGARAREDNVIKITIEIPTGEGKSTLAAPEEQVKKQLLEQLMKSIIKPGAEGP